MLNLRRYLARAAITLFGSLLMANRASALPVYSDTFDNGFDFTTSSGTSSTAFWYHDNTAAYWNGYITNTTADGLTGLGHGEPTGNGLYSLPNLQINHDASGLGTGNFYFAGTQPYPTNGGVIPNTDQAFYIGNSFAVAQNTDYTVSFALTNADGAPGNSVADILPEINDVALGSAVSANGYFTDNNPADEWQTFSYSFNSGTNTSLFLSLLDLQPSTTGNDFGIDNIQVTATVPEISPSSALMPLALSGFSLLLLADRRRRDASTSAD